MNWIERLYEIKNKDLYSQGGEGLILEYILNGILPGAKLSKLSAVDIGSGDGFVLSNTRHIYNLGCHVELIDKINKKFVTRDNVIDLLTRCSYEVLSIDIDGNDYWILDKIFEDDLHPLIIVAEFNAMYTDSRTIAYNPDHVWAGDSYYGFTFEAGVRLAEKHGYKVIFQTGDMNMFMVRADLIEGLNVPPVTYKQNDFFKISERKDWVTV